MQKRCPAGTRPTLALVPPRRPPVASRSARPVVVHFDIAIISYERIRFTLFSYNCKSSVRNFYLSTVNQFEQQRSLISRDMLKNLTNEALGQIIRSKLRWPIYYSEPAAARRSTHSNSIYGKSIFSSYFILSHLNVLFSKLFSSFVPRSCTRISSHHDKGALVFVVFIPRAVNNPSFKI